MTTSITTEDFEIVPVAADERPVFQRLFELYEHDFSEMTGEDAGSDGLFTSGEFWGDVWGRPNAHHFLLRVAGHWAGFAWVVTGQSYVTPGADCTWMDEFFIMRKHRRRGLGERLAVALFDRFPGRWEVGEITANTPAQAFWRAIIGRYTGGDFREVVLDEERWRGPIQIFESQGR
jgi:predicted acetyltransferase